MSDVSVRLDQWVQTPGLEARARIVFRQIVMVLILLAVWISSRPFAPVPDAGSDVPSGDIVNQITFSLLALMAMLGVSMVDRRAFAPLLQPSWMLLIAWMGLSVILSTQPAISMRAAAFTLIAMGLAASIFILPPDSRRFHAILFGVALFVLGFSWFGVLALPDRAIHTDYDPFEPEHAGSWRGHFDHKNIAGGMMVILALTGLHALRMGRRWVGLALTVGAVVFLYMTKSKTSLGLLPATVLIVTLAVWLPGLVLRTLVLLTPVVALITLTVGSALIPAVRDFNLAVLGDPSFTGRYDIWRYGFEKLAEDPLTGFGFEAFWRTPITMYGESRLELAWEVGKIVHGHNAYLDVALTMGIPGLLIAFWCLVLKPIADFDRAMDDPSNRPLAIFCISVWLYVSLAMCLESYYFRRADPVWFGLLIAVFGLRYAATFRIDRSPSPAAQAS